MIARHALGAAALGVSMAFAALSAGGAAEAAQPGRPEAPPPPVKPALSEEAFTAVTQMGKTLSTRDLSFTANTIRVYLDPYGQPLHIFHTLKVVVRRPDRLVIQITGDDGANGLFYDGKSATMFAPASKTYSVVAAQGDIPTALDQLADKLNVDYPLVEFFADTPENSLFRGVIAGWQVGTATIDGVDCRHLFFAERAGTDLELWVENNAAATPHRLIVTYRMLPGQPSFIAEFTNWNTEIHPSDAEFSFQPPPDAKRIDLPEAATAELPQGSPIQGNPKRLPPRPPASAEQQGSR